MRKAAIDMLRDPIARGVINLALAVALCAVLFWIATAYLDPGLRKAVIFSGVGMC